MILQFAVINTVYIIVIIIIIIITIIIIIIIIVNIKSLLTYFKQIAIHKLKVEKRTIKKYLQFISMKKETTFKPIFFL